MRKRILTMAVSFTVLFLLGGCGGRNIHGAGGIIEKLPVFTGAFWHLLILAGIVFVAILVNQKGEANEDSLFKLGNRLRNLEDRIEDLERKIENAAGGGKKGKKEEKAESAKEKEDEKKEG